MIMACLVVSSVVRSFTSFPTRRSSDLELARALAEFLFDDDRAMVRIDMSEYQEKHTVARSSSNRNRSEEHTSELQSPYDLVCRLLLEKKKELHSNIRPAGSDPH